MFCIPYIIYLEKFPTTHNTYPYPVAVTSNRHARDAVSENKEKTTK